MRSNGQAFHRCLPAEFQIWDEHVGPIGFVLNQSCANWILTDVSKFLGQTFIMTQAMIEEISLPLYARQFCRDPFVIANQLRKRIPAIDPDQRMQVIWHEQE